MTSRVARAAAVAVVIGAVAFAIWWGTAPARRKAEGERQQAQGRSAPRLEAPVIRRGGTLRGAIDPNDSDALAKVTTALTTASLFRINPATEEIEGRLALDFAQAKAGTYKVTLRPGVRWSDGSPLTADEVVARLRAMRFGAASATGPLTLEVNTLRPLADVPITAPGKYLGPFLPQDATTFVRNPRYWNKAKDGTQLPYLDRIELVPGDVSKLLAGDIDFIETELAPATYTALKRADADGKVHLYDAGPGLSVDAIESSQPPAASSQLFHAISVAINRRELCDAVYLGACDPVITPITPGNAAWFDADLPIAGPDPELAKSMLAGLSLPPAAKQLRLMVANDVPALMKEAEFVRDELKPIGITVTIVSSGQHAATLRRITLPDTDPATDPAVWQFDKRSTALMATVIASPDKAARLQAFADLQKHYVEQLPAICLAAPYTYVVTNPRVLNVRVSKRKPALLWNADMLAK